MLIRVMTSSKNKGLVIFVPAMFSSGLRVSGRALCVVTVGAESSGAIVCLNSRPAGWDSVKRPMYSVAEYFHARRTQHGTGSTLIFALLCGKMENPTRLHRVWYFSLSYIRSLQDTLEYVHDGVSLTLLTKDYLQAELSNLPHTVPSSKVSTSRMQSIYM
jgi:hypothetical protein